MSTKSNENTPMVPERRGGREPMDTPDLNLDSLTGPSEIDFTINRSQQIVSEERMEVEESTENCEDEKMIYCKGCNEVFPDELHLTEHLQRSFKCVGYDTRCPSCQRFFRGERGWKIHMSRSKCKDKMLPEEEDAHCLSNDSESEVLTSQVQPHSTLSHHEQNSDLMALKNVLLKKPIRWPRMSDVKCWSELESIVKAQLPERFYVRNAISLLETILYEEASKLFGVVEYKKKENKLSRRQQQMLNTKRELQGLKKAYLKASSEDEKAGISCIQAELKAKWKALRTAEYNRKRRWRRRKLRSTFFKDPFKVAKEILSPKISSEPAVSKETLDDFLKETYSDEKRDIPLGELKGLPELTHPTGEFDNSKLSIFKLQNVLKKKRNASRPGPNQIPYKVYKKCPELMKYLLRVIIRVVNEKKIPLRWIICDWIFFYSVERD